MASAPPLHRIEGLTKVYGEGETAIAALRGVDLDVPASAMVVLLGPSGSGKSTFLNIVGGLDRATEGHVHFEELQLTHGRLMTCSCAGCNRSVCGRNCCNCPAAA